MLSSTPAQRNPASPLPLSVAIVAYHGDKTIERCFKSVADLADEIIVVHDGPCEDQTLAIAQRYTQQIFIRPRVGIAEPHRVFTYQAARHDWILQIDQDEFLSDELRQRLPDLVLSPSAEGYDFAWPTLHRGRSYVCYSKRALFNRRHFYFIGAPSEHLRPRHKSTRLLRLPYQLEHRPPYDNFTAASFQRKWIPWAQLQAAYYRKKISTIQTFNYSGQDWDPLTKIRLAHPLLLGLAGMTAYSFLLAVRDLIRTRRWLFFKIGTYHSLFQFYLYYYVWSHRQR